MICITGGGTGGHLSIAKALKEEFAANRIKTIYIGSTHGQDRRWFQEDEDFEATYFLQSSGVVNKRGIHKLLSLKDIASSTLSCMQILTKHNIKAVVSVGGYAAAPASFAAIIRGIPLFVHEQNAILGRLNQLLRPFCKRLFHSFAPPYDPYPVQDTFYRLRRPRERLKTIIFLGGSQGSQQINQIALSLAPHLADRGIRILHQCGTAHIHKIQEAYDKLGVEAELFGFDPDLASKMHQADLAISRAGASTLWELTANALPTLFVPYPHAAQDHQRKNAAFLVDQGAARFFTGLQDLFKINLENTSRKLMEIYEPDGAKKIAQEILSNIEG